MLTAPAGLMIYVATRPVDFRKGADGLALLAKETVGHDPMKAWRWSSVRSALTG
ncbi:transposase [Bradyrhizobium sp. GM7.3]